MECVVVSISTLRSNQDLLWSIVSKQTLSVGFCFQNFVNKWVQSYFLLNPHRIVVVSCFSDCEGNSRNRFSWILELHLFRLQVFVWVFEIARPTVR